MINEIQGFVHKVCMLYCMLAKGALLGAQNPSEMGPISGVQITSVLGPRGGGGGGGGPILVGGPKSLLHLHHGAYIIQVLVYYVERGGGGGRGGKCHGLWSGCHIAHHHVLTAKGQIICMNRPRSGTVPKEG